jgi:RNA polymerase sigma-70 factor (ECF subfamily)
MSQVVLELEGQKRKLLSYIFRRDRNRVRSEDILQEVMLRVLEQSRKQDIANPLAYAYRVADSVIYAKPDRTERFASEPLNDDLVCDYPLADEVLQHREKVRIFENALRKLTPLQREIFIKRHFDHKSRQEIADLLGLSVEAVKKHLVRAMVELAGAMEAAHDAPLGASQTLHGGKVRSSNDR